MVDYVGTLLKDLPKEWAFPESEYGERLARTRRAMDAAGVDVLLLHGIVDICYLCGYQTLWPQSYACLIVSREGEPFMQVGRIEAGLAILHGYIKDMEMVSWQDFGPDAVPKQLAQMLESRGFGRKRIGVQLGRIEFGERGPLDAAMYERLKAFLPNTTFVDCTFLMFDIRVKKTKMELDVMRHAAGITTAGMKAAIEAVIPGHSENHVAAAAAVTMIEQGSDPFSIDPIVTTGYRSGVFHTTFKRAVMKHGDYVLIEIGGCYQRYTSPLMRTVAIGKPSAREQRIIDADLNTLDLLYENVKPGRTSHDVFTATRSAIRDIEDEVFRSGHFGYSIGLGFPPTWTDGPMYISEGNEREMEPGMCFHTPLSLRFPGELVIGTSESIVVTETGCEILNRVERDVFVKPH